MTKRTFPLIATRMLATLGAAVLLCSTELQAVPLNYQFQWDNSADPTSPAMSGEFTLDPDAGLLGVYNALSFSGTAGSTPWTRVFFTAVEGALPSLSIEYGPQSWEWVSPAVGGGLVQAGASGPDEWRHFLGIWLQTGSFRITGPGLGVPDTGGNFLTQAALLAVTLLGAVQRKFRN